MSYNFIFQLLVLAVSLLASPAMGAVTLTLDPGATDLSNLVVGETITIGVNLSGLDGLELTTLGGAIEFPAGSFGTPFNSVAGATVPDPSDLILTELPGQMDSQFFAFAGGNIASEGEFFSFQIKALAAGSGTIAFNPLSRFAEDQQLNAIFDIDTNSLNFTIRAAQSDPVPEPASLLTWLLVGLLARGAASCRLRRGRA
jgi:hypothetical protein